MPKHLTEYQEGYIKWKLENNVSWAIIKKDFQKKFDRVSKKSKKIKGAETRGRKRKTTTLQDAQIIERQFEIIIEPLGLKLQLF